MTKLIMAARDTVPEDVRKKFFAHSSYMWPGKIYLERSLVDLTKYNSGSTPQPDGTTTQDANDGHDESRRQARNDQTLPAGDSQEATTDTTLPAEDSQEATTNTTAEATQHSSRNRLDLI